MTEERPISLQRRAMPASTQRALLASQLRSPQSPVQNMAMLVSLPAGTDPERLAAAFRDVVANSDALRSTFAPGDTTRAAIAGEPPAGTEIIQLPAADTDAWARQRARRPIDLSAAAYDSVIAVHEDSTLSWLWNMHHVVTDARSNALIMEATDAIYHGTGEAPKGRFYQVASAQTLDGASDAARPRFQRAQTHWDTRPPMSPLGRLYDISQGRDPSSTRVPVIFSDPVASLVENRLSSIYRALSPELAATTLLVATAALHAHALTGASELAVGIPVHNRRSADALDVIGPLVELFPVDVRIKAGDTVAAFHSQVAKAVTTTLRNALPGTAPDPDFSIVVNVIPGDGSARFGDEDVPMAWLPSGAMDADHVMRVQLTGYASDSAGTGCGFGAGTHVELDLNDSAVPSHVRGHTAGHFAAAMAHMVTDPDARLDDLSLVSESERERLLTWETGPARPGPAPLLADRLAAVLGDNADVVVIDGDDQLTGTQLWNWVCAVAADFIGEDRISIELTPSVHAVVSAYAAMVAGVAFVPIDPANPENRRDNLVALAGVSRRIRACEDIDPLRPTVDQPAETLPLRASPNDEAYVIFTSGSTGEPKGVPITHQGVADYIAFAEASYCGDGEERALCAPLFGSLAFDLTITTLFAPILAGGSLITIGDSGPAAISAIARHPKITWCKATPSHLELLLRLLPEDHDLSTYVVGGEAFTSRLANAIFAHNPNARVFNEYGPTEAVVGCMIHQADPSATAGTIDVPIGAPAPGVTLRVVNSDDRRVPPGASGELLIAHDGVTSGYINAAEDAAAPFVTIDGHRFYRSGDLVQLDADDQLVYRGRIDEQIKVGGIRLDPLEVEDALDHYPGVERSVVRLWSPELREPDHHCVRCGLPDTVPAVSFDEDGVCDTCASFDRVKVATTSWFRTPVDLVAARDAGRSRSNGPYDALALLSGGKDSTYALYQLVEHGFRPYAMTLDNGYISEGAKENVRQVTSALGVDHDFVTSPAMDEIFRDSLATFSNVCNGCYKTIYTLAVNRADELDIPIIVTGLSRGQLFETRLIPEQFRLDRFDPDTIDRAVLQARKHYHRAADVPNRLLDTAVFDDDELFERIQFVDIYRYLDVELEEMIQYLEQKTPWQRPADTGRSTNCLINVAGIHTHLTEQGYHNYAVPYAWDVRLGHKTRDEAIAELEDNLDLDEVSGILSEIGYSPTARSVLTAWLQMAPGVEAPSPTALRSFAATRLPAHAIPAAFVAIDDVPMTTNGKLDLDALPDPKRVHRSGVTAMTPPGSETERRVVEAWEGSLGIEPIGIEDDFFAIGGDSLAALAMIVGLAEDVGVHLGEELAFVHTTPRALAAAIDDAVQTANEMPAPRDPLRSVAVGSANPSPTEFIAPEGTGAFTVGETSILFEQRRQPERHMYNLGRVFQVHGPLDQPRFERAFRAAAEVHGSLSHSFGSNRQPLSSADAIEFSTASASVPTAEVEAVLEATHRAPFNLADGPIMRVRFQPVDDGSTAVLIAAHHVACDLESFARLWESVDAVYGGEPVSAPAIDLRTFAAWQRQDRLDAKSEFWRRRYATFQPTEARFEQPDTQRSAPDDLLRTTTSITAAELRALPGLTPAAVAVTAAATALSPFFRDELVPLSFVSSTRTHADAAELVGYLLNPLPMQIRPKQEASVFETAQQITQDLGASLPWRDHPFAHMVSDARRAGHHVDATSILVSVDEEPTASFDGNSVTHRAMFNGNAVGDLAFFVEVRKNEIDLSLEYRASVITREQARLILKRTEETLVKLVRSPDTKIADLVPAGVAEQTATTTVSVAEGPALESHELIIDQTLRCFDETPAAAAVECGTDILTWGDVDQRSAAVASTLQARGIGRGDRVIVALGRGVNAVSALVGVHRCGAAYVPIDPSYPESRIQLIATEAAATTAIIGETVPGLNVANQIRIDGTTIDGVPWSQVNGPLPVNVFPDDDAYVIFTSGSTGVPSGVAVTHAQLAASTNARAQVYDAPPTRFGVLSSIAFDSSIVGLFWTLATGGTIVFPLDNVVRDIDALLELFFTAELSHMLCVPSLYRALLRRRSDTAPAGWPNHVIVAGESCGPALVRDHFESTTSALTNEYGPTECTVWATAHHCSPDDLSDRREIPIGNPVPGTWIAVVDSDNQPVAEGVDGELVIGGANLTAGYANDPARTETRFTRESDLLHPRLPGGHFFRSGDSARMLDGVAYFSGRIDDQLNVGGMRAEAAEIERVAAQHPQVNEVIVGATDVRTLDELLRSNQPEALSEAMRLAAETEDPTLELSRILRTNSEPTTMLVGHLEVGPGAASHAQIVTQVRSLIAEAFPAGLRPTNWYVHDALARTPNNKLDRGATLARSVDPVVGDATPVPGPIPRAGSDTRPTQDPAHRITAIYRSVLKNSSIAAHDSFFDVGGDSLMTLELLDALEPALGIALSTSVLFEHPTPRGLADHLAQEHDLQGDTGDNSTGRDSSRAAAAAHVKDAPEAKPLRSLVVPIQSTGDQTPIFAVHHLGRNGELFRPLSKRLGTDQPLWGLAAPLPLEPFGTAEYDLSVSYNVTRIAETYVAEVQRIAPVGPVIIAGTCQGALFAYEVAQQLRLAGREVPLLLMLTDWHAPHIEYNDAGSVLALRRLTELKQQGWTGLRRLLSWRGPRLRIQRRAEIAALSAARKAKQPLPHRLRVRQYIEESLDHFNSYTYEPWPGPAVVVRGSDDLRISETDRTAGWGDLIADLDIEFVPGWGVTILQEPNIDDTARVVSDALARRR